VSTRSSSLGLSSKSRSSLAIWKIKKRYEYSSYCGQKQQIFISLTSDQRIKKLLVNCKTFATIDKIPEMMERMREKGYNGRYGMMVSTVQYGT
jgi:hypothetical protein